MVLILQLKGRVTDWIKTNKQAKYKLPVKNTTLRQRQKQTKSESVEKDNLSKGN
jgi:hypothetical protein